MVRAAWVRASYEGRCNLAEPHAVHRREMLRDCLPAVALVLTHPQRSRRRAEREPAPRLVDVERVAIGEIVGVLLRQPLREHLKAFAPIPGARYDYPALHRDALLVAHARHEPGGVRVVGMHEDRLAAGRAGAAAEPLPSLGRAPQRLDQLPRRPAVAGAKQPPGQCAAPQRSRLGVVSRLERPDQLRTPGDGLAGIGLPVVDPLGLWWIRGRGARLPVAPPVARAVQLDAEMPVPERHVQRALAPVREHDRGVVGEKVRAGNRPARARPSLAALDREDALTGGDVEPVAHPPDSACMTQTSPSVGTASLKCARSRICRPLTNTTMWRRTAP